MDFNLIVNSEDKNKPNLYRRMMGRCHKFLQELTYLCTRPTSMEVSHYKQCSPQEIHQLSQKIYVARLA
jgi:hypothetical protein